MGEKIWGGKRLMSGSGSWVPDDMFLSLFRLMVYGFVTQAAIDLPVGIKKSCSVGQ